MQKENKNKKYTSMKIIMGGYPVSSGQLNPIDLEIYAGNVQGLHP